MLGRSCGTVGPCGHHVGSPKETRILYSHDSVITLYHRLTLELIIETSDQSFRGSNFNYPTSARDMFKNPLHIPRVRFY
jgi:hypothetical protein